MVVSSSGSGVTFCPDNQECIALLMSKVYDPSLTLPDIRNDLDPYNQNQLSQMFMAAKLKEFYFFTKLRRKGKSGSKNADRTVGKGTWHGDQHKHVTYPDIGDVGTLHTFTYEEPGSVNHKRFLMYEYHLLEDTCLEYDPLKNHVLCVLRYNKDKKKRNSDVSYEETATKRLRASSSVVTDHQDMQEVDPSNSVDPTSTSSLAANSVSWTSSGPQYPVYGIPMHGSDASVFQSSVSWATVGEPQIPVYGIPLHRSDASLFQSSVSWATSGEPQIPVYGIPAHGSDASLFQSSVSWAATAGEPQIPALTYRTTSDCGGSLLENILSLTEHEMTSELAGPSYTLTDTSTVTSPAAVDAIFPEPIDHLNSCADEFFLFENFPFTTQ